MHLKNLLILSFLNLFFYPTALEAAIPHRLTPEHHSVAEAPADTLSHLDSLMLEENRYRFPDTLYTLGRELEAQVAQGDSILDVLSHYAPSYRGPREPSDIQRYYARYNLMKHRVHPAAASLPKNIDSEYPAANPLFMPPVFDAYRDDMKLQRPAAFGHGQEANAPHSDAEQYIQDLRHDVIHQVEREHFSCFRYSTADIPRYERIEVMLEAKRPMHIDNAPQLEFQPMRGEVKSIKPKYTYWDIRGRISAQMTQTYISENWSSGGQSNMSGLYSFYWRANYNDKKNIQFDNFIDWKIGLNTNSADTIRGYSISNDQLQLSSKLGVKAVNNWYYSMQAEFITQTLTNYKTNASSPSSALFSPAKLFVSLGMDFKTKSKDKKHSISVLMTPFTYRMNFLRDTLHFNSSKYGIEKGKRVGHEFGFKLTANYDWKISEDISWNSYYYYYSDFSYIDSEWKNTLNFRVNQYLTTQLFIHTKLNDREFKRGEGKHLLQLKEFLSFGVIYYW